MSTHLRQDRPVASVPGFHCHALDGVTLKEYATLLMAQARRTADKNAGSAALASGAVADGAALMHAMGADEPERET